MATTTDSSAKTILGKTFGVATFPSSVCRLSDETRAFAVRVLAGEYGAQMRSADFALSSEEQTLPDELRAAAAVMAIARQAPLRVMPGERLAGASTLLEAIFHRAPLAGVQSTSHTTIGFEQVLHGGLCGLRRRIVARRARGNLSSSQSQFLDAMEMCLDAMAVWHRRLMDELARQAAAASGPDAARFREVRTHLARVPEQAPRNFREAVQALWFLWEFQRLCGNWSGLGRLDQMLGPFLQQDLACGSITLEEARELLAHFWIKGCEWIMPAESAARFGGDAQFYQNVILAGIDADGREVTNEVTYLVFDIVEELHVSDFPVAVRVNAATPERLWRRIAEVQRLGGGIVSLYNEDMVIRALERFGYPTCEARTFTNDGCWEVIIPGKTAFTYRPFDMLVLLQESLGLGPDNLQVAEFANFEALYRDFRNRLRTHLQKFRETAATDAFLAGRPAPLFSLFVDECIERARGYHDRGARYSVCAPHAGGLPDTVNSLLSLKKIVFDAHELSLAELIEILKDNWRGHEALRQRIRREITLYGNDDQEADAMLQRVFDDYTALVGELNDGAGELLHPAGISTFGRELAFRDHRRATAFGALEGDILATNMAPTPGTDTNGPTAVIQSFCTVEFEKLTNGTPLELKIHPASLANKSGLHALIALLRTFVRLGGFYVHVDVVDSDILKQAQQHPERFPNLSVRIAGWSARFTTLGKEWQDMIIQRTQQYL